MAAALDAQHDGQAAVRWLRAHATQYGIDPDRIAWAAVRPAPTWRSSSARTARTRAERHARRELEGRRRVSISGVLPAEGQALLGADDAPTLWFIGSEDPLIPDENEVPGQRRRALQRRRDQRPRGAPGSGHVPIGTDGPTIFTQSAYFLYFTLDLAHAAGQPPAAAAATAALAERLRARASR